MELFNTKDEQSTQSQLTKSIKMKALELGFSRVGVTSADDFTDLAQELSMREDYQARWCGPKGENSLLAGCFPRLLFPEGKSIICTVVGFSDIGFPDSLSGCIGRAYLSRCYLPTAESIAGLRVQAFKDYLTGQGIKIYQGPEEIPARAACFRAGAVSWGRNNFARTKEDGSFIILYTFLVDAKLDVDCATDVSLPENRCLDNCTLCQDACPTKALSAPARLEWKKCILFNNLRGGANEDLRDSIGCHIHGCDICQLVCPRNKEALTKPKRPDPFLEELAKIFDLEKLLVLDQEYYEQCVYPIMYNYIKDLEIFKRNAAIALGNSGDKKHLDALRQGYEKSNDSDTREIISWAIGKLDQ